MEEVKDIILHVYTLAPQSAPRQQQDNNGTAATSTTSTTTTTTTSTSNNNSNSNNKWSSFLMNTMLPSIGMGAYHTCIQIGYDLSSPYTTIYTFVANHGIVQQKRNLQQNVPLHASYKEQIIIGSCNCLPKQIVDVIEYLSNQYFTSTSYHLVHRNCNHFTETLSIALIHYHTIIQQQEEHDFSTSSSSSAITPISSDTTHKQYQVTTYPDWVNRLAKTGTNIISHDDDIVSCIPIKEAVEAVLQTYKRHAGSSNSKSTTIKASSPTTSSSSSWNIFGSKKNGISSTSRTATSAAGSTGANSSSNTNQKKELTETQKKLLNKIRKK